MSVEKMNKARTSVGSHQALQEDQPSHSIKRKSRAAMASQTYSRRTSHCRWVSRSRSRHLSKKLEAQFMPLEVALVRQAQRLIVAISCSKDNSHRTRGNPVRTTASWASTSRPCPSSPRRTCWGARWPPCARRLDRAIRNLSTPEAEAWPIQ